MKTLRIKDDLVIVLDKVQGINMMPSSVVKDDAGNDVPVKAKVSILLGAMNITFDYESDDAARAVYLLIIKALSEV